MPRSDLKIHSCVLLCVARPNLGPNSSAVRLYCVTISWQQIFEDSLQVTITSILLHAGIERRYLGR